MKRTAFKEIKKYTSFVRRLCNAKDKVGFLFYRAKWNVNPKIHVLSRSPIHVDIELTNRCNLMCVMCPHGFPNQEFKKSLGDMSMETAKLLVDDCSANGVSSIKFNWRGEPLIWNEDISQIIRYAKEKGIIDVILNTNGIFLDKDLSRNIIEAGLDQIIFSVDGNTPATYAKIRRGGDFDKLVTNIENFIELRKSLCRPTPLVRIQMVKVEDNLKDVDGFIKRWLPLADSISFQDYTNRGESNDRLCSDKDLFVAVGRRACPQIWQRIVVTWDRKVVMCCRDWDSKNTIGMLDYSTGKDIGFFWRSKKLNDIRDMHLKGNLNGIKACAECSYRESFLWKSKEKNQL